MEILTCNLDRKSEIPLYEQLYTFIKTEIMESRIAYGTKLPSKRKLSKFLLISQNTIEQAYDQLVAEGYIEGVPRKGFFVLAHEDLEYTSPIRYPSMEEENVTKIEYNFHPSRIDTEHFPFDTWRKYARKIIDKDNQSLLLMGDWQGEKLLREEIAQYIYQSRGVQATAEDIILGAGVETLLQQLIILLGENKSYGVEDPGYHAISRILKNYHNSVFPLEVDGKGVKIENLEIKNPDIVYVTPSRHFPYGSILSANRRIKLLNWASVENNRYIIEDDYDSEFRYEGKSIPSLQSMDKNGKVIYLGSFSKSLIPSLRISYMVLPNQLMKQYKEKLSFFQCSVSRIDQHMLAHFMKDGEFEKHLNRMRKVYRRKMNLTLELIQPFQDKIEIIGDLSGFHLVIKVKINRSEQELLELATKKNIKVYPLSIYLLENHEEKHPIFILGFAGIPEATLPEAIQALLISWEIE
ncbi:MocR-like pyridoxine biosynthesis transcription factor PdxR [Oceanobacillus sp. CAU 1775]